MRRPKIDIDGKDAAWLIPWANRQLARFKKLFKEGKRQWKFPAGEEVTIWWGLMRDKIRIVATPLFGFISARMGVSPFHSIKGVVTRGGLEPSFPASSTVTPYGGSAPIWSKNRATALYNSTGVEGIDRIYHGGLEYTPVWDHPLVTLLGAVSSSDMYVSNDGLTVVLAMSWIAPASQTQPTRLHNKLTFVPAVVVNGIETEPATWNETYSRPDLPEVAAIIAAPPGSAVYMEGSGVAQPHFRLSVTPSFPGTVTGGEDAVHLYCPGPYNLPFIAGGSAGASRYLLIRGAFSIPVSVALEEQGFTWSSTDTTTTPPTIAPDDPMDANDYHLVARLVRYTMTYNSYSFSYSYDLLEGTTTLLQWSEATNTRGMWVKAVNDSADGVAEVYSAGIEVEAMWLEDGGDALAHHFGPALVGFTGVVGWPHTSQFVAAISGWIDNGGSSLLVSFEADINVRTDTALLSAHSHPTIGRFLWTNISPATYITVSSHDSSIGNYRYIAIRDAVVEYVKEAAAGADPFGPAIQLGTGMPSHPGAMFPISLQDAGSDSLGDTIVKEYLAWDDSLVDSDGVLQVTVYNSATSKYQHEITDNFDLGTHTYKLYEGGVEKFATTGLEQILAHATDAEKWYATVIGDPTILREYERTQDPDTLVYSVDFVEINVPASFVYDALTFDTGIFVRPFITMSEGLPG